MQPQKIFKYLALFFFLIFQLSHIRKRKKKKLSTVDVTAPVQIEAGLFPIAD